MSEPGKLSKQFKKDTDYSVSIVIPAYNEARTIEKCVHLIETHLLQLGNDFEIVAVNDASTDKTGELLETLKETRSYLKVAHHKTNRKLGGTLRTGFSLCRKDLVFYSDADLPFDFEQLARAIHILNLKDADIVTGFRHDRTSEGSLRIAYSFVYNWLIRLLFKVYIRDINFSFKLIRREALENLELKSEGSFIDAEMIVKAARLNYFICQIGIDYFKRKYGTSTLSSPSVILKIFQELIMLYPEIMKIR